MKFATELLPGHQGEAELLHWYQEPRSRKAVLILPGQSYAPDRSPLELIGQMARAHGYELLCLRYSFQVSPYDTDPMGLDDLEREVDHLLPHLTEYDELCLVGKSLGSSMVRRLLPKVAARERSLILLTPLPDSVEGESSVDQLCLIGDADPVYQRLAAVREAHPAQWRVYPGASHGLQVRGDWRATAQLWQLITAEAEAFLTRKELRGCSPHWERE